jgi:hypothetical protein
MIRNKIVKHTGSSTQIGKMDAVELAGYYLKYYPNDPITPLYIDMADIKISTIIGNEAVMILQAILDHERRDVNVLH